jgi:hypothetical protein
MQVTAIINGWEIGFGMGDGAAYAIEECIDSIDAAYFDEGVIGEVELMFSDVGNSTMPKYAKLTDYCYAPRQYF